MEIAEVLDKYLERGFGSMNKNDFEVWIFSQLLLSELNGMDNYAISLKLRIPESKVKRLRYEASLKYGQYDEKKLTKKINNLLQKSFFKKNGASIQFVVEDVYVRKHLDSILKKSGSFSDSSFNSEIVSVTISDLETILKYDEEGRNQMDKLLQKAKEKFGEETTFVSLMKKIGEASLNSIVDLSVSGIVGCFQGLN